MNVTIKFGSNRSIVTENDVITTYVNEKVTNVPKSNL